jgi:hypothetical protein
MPKKKLIDRKIKLIGERMRRDAKQLLDDRLVYGSNSNIKMSAPKLMDLFKLLERVK